MSGKSFFCSSDLCGWQINPRSLLLRVGRSGCGTANTNKMKRRRFPSVAVLAVLPRAVLSKAFSFLAGVDHHNLSFSSSLFLALSRERSSSPVVLDRPLPLPHSLVIGQLRPLRLLVRPSRAHSECQVVWLSPLTWLEELTIAVETAFDGLHLASLSRLRCVTLDVMSSGRWLRNFSLHGLPPSVTHVTANGIQLVRLFGALPSKLLSLSLRNALTFSSDAVDYAAVLPQTLTHLELPSAIYVSDEHLQALAALPHLRSLVCDQLTARTPPAFQRLQHLECRLLLEGGRGTPQTIARITTLQTLVVHCTADVVVTMAVCTRLHDLTLIGDPSRQWLESAVALLVKAPLLRHLTLVMTGPLQSELRISDVLRPLKCRRSRLTIRDHLGSEVVAGGHGT
jgi:hypothetical protein